MSMQAIASSGKAPTKLIMGMMLLPLFMALAFPVMFLTAFHDPTPKDMNVTVIESTKKAGDIAHSLEVQSEGKLHVDTVATVDDAKSAVMDRDTRAAYDPKTGDLFLAGGNGKSMTGIAQQIFQPVAQQSNKTLAIQDLAPLTAKDIMGTGFIYMCMIGMMTGYMTALMMNMFGRHLGVWKQLAVIGGMAVAAAVITVSTTYNVFQVYDIHMVYSMLIVAAIFITVGVFQLGLARLVGQASAFFGIIVFIILGMPTSGISMPVDMMDGFFRVINKFHPLAAAGDMMRSNLYFNGTGIANDIIVLATWLLVGVGLLLLGLIKAPATPAGPAGAPAGQDHAAPSAAEAGADRPAVGTSAAEASANPAGPGAQPAPAGAQSADAHAHGPDIPAPAAPVPGHAAAETPEFQTQN